MDNNIATSSRIDPNLLPTELGGKLPVRILKPFPVYTIPHLNIWIMPPSPSPTIPILYLPRIQNSYDPTRHWTELLNLCMQRREQTRERWRQLGGKIGLKEKEFMIPLGSWMIELALFTLIFSCCLWIRVVVVGCNRCEYIVDACSTDTNITDDLNLLQFLLNFNLPLRPTTNQQAPNMPTKDLLTSPPPEYCTITPTPDRLSDPTKQTSFQTVLAHFSSPECKVHSDEDIDEDSVKSGLKDEERLFLVSVVRSGRVVVWENLMKVELSWYWL